VDVAVTDDGGAIPQGFTAGLDVREGSSAGLDVRERSSAGSDADGRGVPQGLTYDE
jgi:hypothetical protein